MATLDDQGETTVTLPGWFTALNTDFCYQLTALGHAAPGLHIATEISDNRFTIAGGHGGSNVSWQVTGIRQDPWAQVHPLVVEDDKTTEEQGYYLHPELYDAAETLSITRLRHGDLPARPRQRHETTGTHPGRRVK